MVRPLQVQCPLDGTRFGASRSAMPYEDRERKIYSFRGGS